MTQLLVSVRDAAEAKIACEHEIGILDVKEPSRGGLGASDPETLREIVQAVPSSLVKSFSAGELDDWSDEGPSQGNPLHQRYGHELLKQFQFIKVGMANLKSRDWKRKWSWLFQGLSSDAPKKVGVIYLDSAACHAPNPKELLQFYFKNQCEAILLDTCHKTGNLFDYVSSVELETLIELAVEAELKIVVAGSVRLEHLPEITNLQPSYIGVRGAVCNHNRTGKIDSILLGEFENRLRDCAKSNATKFL